jgi:hypothetical protein
MLVKYTVLQNNDSSKKHLFPMLDIYAMHLAGCVAYTTANSECNTTRDTEGKGATDTKGNPIQKYKLCEI